MCTQPLVFILHALNLLKTYDMITLRNDYEALYNNNYVIIIIIISFSYIWVKTMYISIVLGLTGGLST